MSETVTIDGAEYKVDDLSDVCKAALNGYMHSIRKIDIAKVDFEIATASREHYLAIVKSSLPAEEVEDDSTGTD